MLRGIGDRVGSKCEVDFDEWDSDLRSGAFGVDDFCDDFCGLKSDGVLWFLKARVNIFNLSILSVFHAYALFRELQSYLINSGCLRTAFVYFWYSSSLKSTLWALEFERSAKVGVWLLRIWFRFSWSVIIEMGFGVWERYIRLWWL